MQRKSFLQLATRASWSYHLLAQTSFQLAPKTFWLAELISQFFCYSLARHQNPLAPGCRTILSLHVGHDMSFWILFKVHVWIFFRSLPPLNFCKDHFIPHLFDVFSLNTFLIQDILIDCGKAVTSINLNPITPYHLGLGCEDSTVRVFDRRALSSGSSNKMNGMFCQFRPDSLSDRTCRVTSLNYR